MKLILLNGPPRCGKDTAAEILHKHYLPRYSVRRERFSYPHKLAFAAMTKRFIDSVGNVEYYEDHKSEVIPWLGVSYRQWQIDFSEKFMKPLYGQDIFARMFLNRQATRKDTPNYLCIVSDCGFQIEADTVAAVWNPNDLMLLTIDRPGCSFEGDSREWVDLDVGHGYDIGNTGSISTFKDLLLKCTEDFLP